MTGVAGLSTIAGCMRELQYVKARQLVWRDAAEPSLLLATDVIVRPFLAARCDGDSLFLHRDAGRLLTWGATLHICDQAFESPRSNPFVGPFAYGHECVAEVIACGSAVQQFALGDRVIVPWAVSCGSCAMCAAWLTS